MRPLCVQVPEPRNGPSHNLRAAGSPDILEMWSVFLCSFFKDFSVLELAEHGIKQTK